MDIDDLTATQINNARSIYTAAFPYGADAIKASLMAAGAESSFKRYANNGLTTRDDVPVKWRVLAATSMNYPHDAVAGQAWTTADSVGLYQQRAMYGYGTIAELMDPVRSTEIFLTGNKTGTTRGFLKSPATMSIAQRVQWTQGSEFPTGENYAPIEHVADQLIARFKGESTSNIPASPPTEEEDWPMPTKEELKALLDDSFKTVRGTVCIKDAESGWVYSIAPGHFYAVSEKVLSHGLGTGFLYLSPQALNWVQLAQCRDWAFSGKGDEAAAAGTASAVWRTNGQWA